MRDWCSECKFENYGGSQEPCYNCITAYNKKPSEFTPAADEVRGVGEWLSDEEDTALGMEGHCSKCCCCTPNIRFKYCPNCGAKMEVRE